MLRTINQKVPLIRSSLQLVSLIPAKAPMAQPERVQPFRVNCEAL